MLADYVTAFENYDVARIVELLSEDAVWEMPPYDGWYSGPEAIGQLIDALPGHEGRGPGDGAGRGERPARIRPVHATAGRPYEAFQLQVLTVEDGGCPMSVLLRHRPVRSIRSARHAGGIGRARWVAWGGEQQPAHLLALPEHSGCSGDRHERDRLSTRLNAAYEAGTLDSDDYRSRLDTLFAAQRLGQLVPVVEGLPPLQTYTDPRSSPATAASRARCRRRAVPPARPCWPSAACWCSLR